MNYQNMCLYCMRENTINMERALSGFVIILIGCFQKIPGLDCKCDYII